MNIVFFGTSDFAVPVLRELIGSSHEIKLVVTQPDRPKGRNLRLSQSPVKCLAESRAIPVYQPSDASSPAAIAELSKVNADIFVVVSFGQILKRPVLDIPKICCVNLHASLLPKYRGASPINRAVMNGDKVSGVTVIRMNEKLDQGDMVLSRELAIDPGDTAITLGEGLAGLGAKALLEAIDLLGSGKAVFAKQNDKDATFAPKLTKADGRIDWTSPAEIIHSRVRALIPWPGAYTIYAGKTLKVLATEVCGEKVDGPSEPGVVAAIINGKGIIVRTGTSDIAITHLQLEGGKILEADAFVRGHRVLAGYKFT